MLRRAPGVIHSSVGLRWRDEPVALPPEPGHLSWLTGRVALTCLPRPPRGRRQGRAGRCHYPEDSSGLAGELSASHTPKRLDAPD